MAQAAKLSDLLNSEKVNQKLIDAGLSEKAAGEKAELFRQSTEALLNKGNNNQAEAYGFFVPGRIEVLGKHTDYAGGRSLIATAEKGFCMVAAAREDSTVRITAAAQQEMFEFDIAPDLIPEMGHWSNYPVTVARRVARNFPGRLRGCDVAFVSDLPTAAGMSSSSAMMVAFFLVLARINQLEKHDAYIANIDCQESLAGYLGTVENGQNFGSLAGDKGVGTFGGSEDHTAILCCQAERLRQYSYCPVRFERSIRVPDEYVFAIASSGVVAEKTGAALEKYNRASKLAAAVTEEWRRATGQNNPHIASITGDSPENVDRIREILQQHKRNEFTAKELLDRFEHFYAESEEIIPAASEALAQENMAEFGRQVDRSQELADSLLGNQVPETIYLAQSARQLGAVAASGFGAGFGGSVWAMIKTEGAKEFLEKWERQYDKKLSQYEDSTEGKVKSHPAKKHAGFFLTRPGPAAVEIKHLTEKREI